MEEVGWLISSSSGSKDQKNSAGAQTPIVAPPPFLQASCPFSFAGFETYFGTMSAIVQKQKRDVGVIINDVEEIQLTRQPQQQQHHDGNQYDYYLLTCEHVVKSMRKDLEEANAFGYSNIVMDSVRKKTVQFPSVGFQKSTIVRQQIPNLSNEHIAILEKLFADTILKSDPSILSTLFDQTLSGLQNYLFGSQQSLEIDLTDSICLDDSIEIQILASAAESEIKLIRLSEDCQLIKIPADKTLEMLEKYRANNPFHPIKPTIPKTSSEGNPFSANDVIGWLRFQGATNLPVEKLSHRTHCHIKSFYFGAHD